MLLWSNQIDLGISYHLLIDAEASREEVPHNNSLSLSLTSPLIYALIFEVYF